MCESLTLTVLFAHTFDAHGHQIRKTISVFFSNCIPGQIDGDFNGG